MIDEKIRQPIRIPAIIPEEEEREEGNVEV